MNPSDFLFAESNLVSGGTDVLRRLGSNLENQCLHQFLNFTNELVFAFGSRFGFGGFRIFFCFGLHLFAYFFFF